MRKNKQGSVAIMASIAVLLASAAQAAPEGAELVPGFMDSPVSPIIFHILMIVTFLGHIVLVNILLGSLILAIIDPRASGAREAGGVAFLPKILAVAVNLGIAPYLFLQIVYESFLYTSIILMALWWLSIVLLIMLAYYGLYVSDGAVVPSLRRPMLALAAMLLLMTAFLLTNANTLMLRPDQWLLWFSEPHGTLLNLGDYTLFPRYLHILLASMAVGGLTMAWRAQRSERHPQTDPTEADRRVRRGLDWFFYASLSQLVAGPLFLFLLPPQVRALFLGGSALHTSALGLVLTGLAIALFLARKGKLKLTSITVLGIILIMVNARGLVRNAMLQPYMEKTSRVAQSLAMPHGQTGALALFLACLVIAVIVIVWLVRVLLAVDGNSENSGSREG